MSADQPGVRGDYRRHLTRLTPACPRTPSCSAYALASVTTLGVRRGLAAAAHRIRGCGRPTPGTPGTPGSPGSPGSPGRTVG